MSLEHDYSVHGGLNRARVGHVLGVVAALVSSAVVTLFFILVDVAASWGIAPTLPRLIFWPFGAFAIYGFLYWLFNRYLWKLRRIQSFLRIPDLSGEWTCSGQTIKPDGSPSYQWEGDVTIVQSWDRLRVRLKTKQSGSNSISAALVNDEADGFRLLYHYRNDPKIGEPELRSHRGFAELTFSKDLRGAEGEYFNGQGRYTFGTMRLSRKN